MNFAIIITGFSKHGIRMLKCFMNTTKFIRSHFMNVKFEELLDILKEEVKPALGCTGPTVFSYVAAEARDAVGGTPKKIIIKADKDKCAKEDDVGIPGTQYRGVKIAAALGAFGGDHKAKLEVLNSVTPEDEKRAYDFSLSDNIIVEPDWSTNVVGVYIDITVETENGIGRAVVVQKHTNLVYKEANGKAIVNKSFDRLASINETADPITNYLISDLYEFVTQIPVEELYFLRESVEMNSELAQAALNDKTGIGLASSMMKRENGNFLGRAKAMTAAGSEARMAGYNLPAMACATSGNVGITASLPLISMAEDLGKTEEDLLRALALSFLMTVMCKNLIGRQSAMCACMVGASQGIAAGAVLLFGGGVKEIEMSINNTIVNVFGVVCDGARMACAVKLSSAIGMAIEGAMPAMDGVAVPADEGVCGKTADDSLKFMGNFARNGMGETDMMLCKSLYAKHHGE